MSKVNILDEVILNIEGNLWTVRDACTGVMVFGMTGSGKSSGPLHKIANKFLTLNFGGVVFCAKPDECVLQNFHAGPVRANLTSSKQRQKKDKIQF